MSLLDERVKLLITAVERPNKKYYNLVRLAQLKEACVAFEKISTIKDALNILKKNLKEIGVRKKKYYYTIAEKIKN